MSLLAELISRTAGNFQAADGQHAGLGGAAARLVARPLAPAAEPHFGAHEASGHHPRAARLRRPRPQGIRQASVRSRVQPSAAERSRPQPTTAERRRAQPSA